jgi:hypothetical protein
MYVEDGGERLRARWPVQPGQQRDAAGTLIFDVLNSDLEQLRNGDQGGHRVSG